MPNPCVLNIVQDATQLKIEEDGLFQPKPGSPFLLEAVITNPPQPMYAFFANGKGIVVPKKDSAPPGSRWTRYSLTITPEQLRVADGPPQPRILKIQNVLRFAVLNTRNGSFQIFEVSVVCQNRSFFLVHQAKPPYRAYRVGTTDRVTYPDVGNWESLDTFLTSKVTASQFTLEDVSQFTPRPSPAVPEGQNMAVIEWYNYANGFGLAQCAEGPARVCWEHIIPNGSRFVHLDPGNIIQYESIGTPVQRSERKTRFTQELFGVQFVSAL